jgi:hypothetical protein
MLNQNSIDKNKKLLKFKNTKKPYADFGANAEYSINPSKNTGSISVPCKQ